MNRSEAYKKAISLGYNGEKKYPEGDTVFWVNQIKLLEQKQRVQRLLEQVKEVATVRQRRIRRNEIIESLPDIEQFFNNFESGEDTLDLTEVVNDYEHLEILLELINEKSEVLADDNIIAIKVDNVYYTLSRDNIDRLLQLIREPEQIGELIRTSDGELLDVVYNIPNEVTLIVMDRPRDIAIQEGGFFRYIHKMDIDLSRYGIFKKVVNDNYKVNCLIRALQNSGVEINISALEHFIKDRIIPKKYLKDIAELYDLHIILKHETNNIGKTKIVHYNKNGKIEIKIGLLDSHYFIIDKTDINSYAIKNYDEVKNEVEWNRIYRKLKNGKYKRDNSKSLDSYSIIKLLLENKDKLLTKITVSEGLDTTYFHDKEKEIRSLQFSYDNCKKVLFETKEIKKLPKIWFDFETITEGEKHEQYLVCWINEENEIGSAVCGGTTEYNTQPSYEFLQSITTESVLIAHNLGYDFRFLYKYLFNINLISKGNKIIMGTAYFKHDKMNIKIKLHFKDSLFIIPMALKNFASAFGLDQKKEVMPYKIYTKENIEVGYVEIKEALKCICGDDKKQFKDNIKKWKCSKMIGDEEYFDIIEYSRQYCILDCKVLKDGYQKFRNQMLEITGLDVDVIATLPSLADKFLIKEGCYDGVYSFSGVVRAFIQKCVVGGRVMCRDNQKWHIKEKLQDFDAVSLYPSAMVRLKGFLKGKPKIITDLSYEKIKRYDGYFVEIKVTKIGKNRHFPIVNELDDDGIRVFSNKLPTGSVFVDNITLEDMVKFQEIEFDIIRGYYFNEGFNSQIKSSMEKLFNARLQKKKEGNKIQLLYKLIMNASYGKTILKPIITETKFFNTEKKAKKYFKRHYNQIKHMVQLGESNKHIVKIINPIHKHFNRSHIGVQILSMSKRIMNEVMYLADDIDAKIYYQDTDSMHIQNDKIELLSELYKEVYERELIGKNLGQFHSDFDFESDVLPVSVESYFLGKKAYIDKVHVENDGVSSFKYHIRMKGIPTKCLSNNPMEIYEKLYKGDSHTVDLVSGSNIMFEYKKNFDVVSRGSFKRTIQFGK